MNAVGFSVQNLNTRCHVNGTGEILAHVLSGVGMSITSTLVCKEYLESGAMVRINAPLLEGRRQFYLIHHGGRYIFPALKAFIDLAS